MCNIIKVGMADMQLCRAPDVLMTLGLGSCVGACIHDPVSGMAGMVHYMLPDSTRINSNINLAKFADTGIRELVRRMEEAGAHRSFMYAKIAGGASMFPVLPGVEHPFLHIGDSNIEAARDNLNALGIRIIAEDVGLNYGRTIEFHARDGSLVIRAVGKDIITI